MSKKVNKPKSERRLKAIAKARKEYWEKLPESEKVEDNLTGFEALLKKAATTIYPENKKRPYRKSRRDKSVKVEKGLFKRKWKPLFELANT